MSNKYYWLVEVLRNLEDYAHTNKMDDLSKKIEIARNTAYLEIGSIDGNEHAISIASSRTFKIS